MNLKRLIQDFTELVQIDSESGNEQNYAQALKKRFEALGFELEFDDAAEHVPSNSGNLYGFRPGNPEKQTLAFSCHLDTVTPGVGIKPQVLEDRITSDGSTILGADDKAPAACLLEAIRSLDESNTELGPIEVLFSVGEEVGMHGARHFDISKLQSQGLLVLDSSGQPGHAIVQAPTAARISAEITGKAAHAGIQPEKGISAIKVMSEAIAKMPLFRIDPETTANVGTISGGSANNIVAEHCKASFEARSLEEAKLDKQVQAMIEALESAAKAHDASLSYQVDHSYPAFRAQPNSAMVQLFEQAVTSLGLEPVLTSTGGGSDANIYSDKGLDVINLAVGMRDAHSVTEHILIEDLESVTQILQAILKLA